MDTNDNFDETTYQLPNNDDYRTTPASASDSTTPISDFARFNITKQPNTSQSTSTIERQPYVNQRDANASTYTASYGSDFMPIEEKPVILRGLMDDDRQLFNEEDSSVLERVVPIYSETPLQDVVPQTKTVSPKYVSLPEDEFPNHYDKIVVDSFHGKLPPSENLFLGIIGGLIGGILGGVVWIVFTSFTGFHFTLISMFLGAMVGVGVRILGHGTHLIYSVIAALIAGILSIIAVSITTFISLHQVFELEYQELIAVLNKGFWIDLVKFTITPALVIFLLIAMVIAGLAAVKKEV